jgi:hypothetical protein
VAETCAVLQRQFDEAITSLSRDCEVDEDCGYAGAYAATCACTPYLGGCGAVPVNRAAVRGSVVERLEYRFGTLGCMDVGCESDVVCTCDCAPPADLRCEDHVCVDTPHSCLEEGPATP